MPGSILRAPAGRDSLMMNFRHLTWSRKEVSKRVEIGKTASYRIAVEERQRETHQESALRQPVSHIQLVTFSKEPASHGCSMENSWSGKPKLNTFKRYLKRQCTL